MFFVAEDLGHGNQFPSPLVCKGFDIYDKMVESMGDELNGWLVGILELLPPLQINDKH